MDYKKDKDTVNLENTGFNYTTDTNKFVTGYMSNADKNATEKSSILGVDANEFNNTFNSTFNANNDYTNKANENANAINSYKDATSQSMISDSTMNKMNSTYIKPSSVSQADAWLSNQLKVIQSGKTSYSDQVREMMDKIANREKFSYDVDTDPLFQQALASATNSGKQAMQDTIGQASALTGGYGSTYATSVGNQAYNSFIEDAYDQLPQYYQMAREAYQMEGDEMYRQLGMYSDADDREYNRNIAAYDATYQMRNRQYDESYNRYRDSKSDAFAMGNLELNMYGQKVQDAYNYYNIASNEADKEYERQYNSWLDSINLAMQKYQLQNQDAWANKNYDQTEDHFTRNLDFQNTWNEKNMAFEDKWNQKKMDFEASENAKNRAVQSAKVKEEKGSVSPTTQQVKGAKAAFENLGFAGYLDFIENLPSDVNIGELDSLVGAESNLGMYYGTYTKSYDAFWHIPGGIDGNDIVKDQDGKEIKVKDLPKDLQEEISQAPVDTEFEWDEKERKWMKVNKSQSGGGSR